MWFIRFWIILIGLGLIYMIVTQNTIQVGSPGHYTTWNLWDHPLRFMIFFAAMAVLEGFLIKVHAKMKEENPKKKKRNRQ